MRKNSWITKWGTWLCAFCCLCVCGVTTAQPNEGVLASAEGTQGYIWGETECLSVASPYAYSNGTVVFQASFSCDLTSTNYKHVAAGAKALKTFSAYDIPNMTHAIIDSLDESGVLDSFNDCIAFNGKKVREWQQSSFLGCMIHLGELGVNNSMTIEFNGEVSDTKITDLSQPFTFTFYEGLKFPSGVELKETVTWIYDAQLNTFHVLNECAPNDTGMSVYYNGQKLTKDNNLVTIYDKEAFSFDNLLVLADSAYATVEIEPQFETLSDGHNYLLITCTAENNLDFEQLQVVFDLQQAEEATVSGCGSIVSSVGCLMTVLSCGIFVMKRSKQA